MPAARSRGEDPVVVQFVVPGEPNQGESRERLPENQVLWAEPLRSEEIATALD
jgi:hypothetical protein